MDVEANEEDIDWQTDGRAILRRFGVTSNGVVTSTATGVFGRALAYLCGVRPGRCDDARFAVIPVRNSPVSAHVWQRTFADRVIETTVSLRGDRFVERFGPLTFSFEASVKDDAARLDLERVGLERWTIRRPRWLELGSKTVHHGGVASRFETEVRVLVLHRSFAAITYSVDMTPELSADADADADADAALTSLSVQSS